MAKDDHGRNIRSGVRQGLTVQMDETTRQALVARRRLNPGLLERGPSKKLAVSDAVQRAASGHRQIVEWDFLVQLVQQIEKGFLETMLHRVSQIHVTLRDFGLRLASLSEQFHHAIGKMTRQAHGAIG